MGGFARRMSYWNAFSQEFPDRPALRVDAGSIFSTGDVEAPIINRWILEGTHRSELDAINLSSWDLPVWQEMADLVDAGMVSKDLMDVPLVSANVTPKSSSFPSIRRHRIRALGAGGKQEVRIGISGLLSDPDGRVSENEFQVENPVAAIRRVTEEIRKQVDFMLVLTDLNLGKVTSLAIQVPEIDVIVVAHNYETVSHPHRVGETLIVTPVNEGRMISELLLDVDSPSGEEKIKTRFVALDRNIPDDPAMGEMLGKAEAELEEFRKKMP